MAASVFVAVVPRAVIVFVRSGMRTRAVSSRIHSCSGVVMRRDRSRGGVASSDVCALRAIFSQLYDASRDAPRS